MVRFASWLAVASVLVAACAREPGGSNEPSTPRVGTTRQANQGSPTSSYRFAVGVCLNSPGPGNCPRRCSGTLIAPNLVLTARHCVDKDTNAGEELSCGVDSFTTRQTSEAQTFITTANTVEQNTTGWHAVTEIRTPTLAEACESDIALLVLSDNVSASEAAPADVLAFGPMTDHSRYSTEITLIGFGLQNPDVPSSGGERRIVENVALECIVGDPAFNDLAFCKNGGLVTLADGGKVDQLSDVANFTASWGGCSGDSGSGAFEQAQFTLGKPLVMGVLSRSGTDSGICLQLTYTRTDHWRDFLVQGVTAAAQAGNYALPSWANGPTVQPATVPGVDSGTKPGDETDSGAATGIACAGASDCASGACVAIDGTAQCVDLCGDDRKCGAGRTCVTLEEHDVCIPQKIVTEPVKTTLSSGGGCTATATPPGARDATLATLGGFALSLVRRRRRR